MHTLRPARDDDYAFVYELQERTMRAYVEAAFDAWDDDWQRAFFAQHWSPEYTRIIEVDGEPAGRIEVHERDDHAYLANINLLPEHQRRGLGTSIIHALIDDMAPRPVTLRVLKSNPDARRLYERLGFELTHEIDTHYYFRFPPATADEALCATSGPQTLVHP